MVSNYRSHLTCHIFGLWNSPSGLTKNLTDHQHLVCWCWQQKVNQGCATREFQTGMSIAVPCSLWVLGFQTGERLRFHTCAYLYTLARIDSKFINKRDAFEIGFQLFSDNEISFHLLNPLLNSTNITYHWKLIKYTNTSQNIRLFNFTSQRYSWLMASAECKRYGMTLPHLMDRKSTMEFVAKILHTFMSPPFAFFVGLIRKVTYYVLISLR